VGVFDHDGPYASEIWGDAQVMSQVLERPGFNRILATLKPGTDVAALTRRLDDDKQVPSKVLTERAYLEGQTQGLSFVLVGLGMFLGAIMGTAAVLTGTNTMLAALASRTHEVGILLAIGFRPWAIFVSFMLESIFIGLLGGVVGCLMILPINGVRTGTTNFQTFTEVAFAFRITPLVLIVAVVFSLALGVLAGTLPALFAAMLRPTQALRRE
jgi:putative ABC transport system permease protein